MSGLDGHDTSCALRRNGAVCTCIRKGEKMSEFRKSNLLAIFDHLNEKYENVLSNDPAFQELGEIACDKHNIAACLAEELIGSDAKKFVSYINALDAGRPIKPGYIIKVTTEYMDDETAKEEETENNIGKQ